MANILSKGNTVCFQGPMDVGQCWKNFSLFVVRVSSVVSGLYAAEIISYGEVDRALKLRPITATLLYLPKGMTISPTYFNEINNDDKTSLNSKYFITM